MTEIAETKVLDTRGMLCPMPVVKAAKEFKSLEDGDILKILATDRGAIADFPAWADDTGNELLRWEEAEDGVLVFWIKKVEEED